MNDLKEVAQKEFYTLKEASKFLCVSVRTLNRVINSGQLRVQRVTKNRLIIHKRWLYAFAIFGKSKLSGSERKEIQEYLKD